MNLKTFILGLLVSFSIPWVAVVGLPYLKTAQVEAVEFDENLDSKTGVYQPKTTGRVANGEKIYSQNGCYLCHTQVIRLTTAGTEMWRNDGWAGSMDPDRGDTRRESTVYDYLGSDYVQIGLTRNGPDLSNFGNRVFEYAKENEVSVEKWIYEHLFNPRARPELVWSFCPSQPQMFKVEPIHGEITIDAVSADRDKAEMIVPNADARALASYLMSFKRDDELPSSISYKPTTAAK